MSKFIIEILKEVNDNPSSITKYADHYGLKMCIYYAFDTRNKWKLPEGQPPYKQDSAPLGMSPGNLTMETKRFYIFCRGDIAGSRREALFVQLLEGVHPTEADLVLAIKDQEIGRIFPNVTYDVVTAICPDIPKEFAAAAYSKSEDKPRGKGRPPGAKNKPKEQPVELSDEDIEREVAEMLAKGIPNVEVAVPPLGGQPLAEWKDA